MPKSTNKNKSTKKRTTDLPDAVKELSDYVSNNTNNPPYPLSARSQLWIREVATKEKIPTDSALYLEAKAELEKQVPNIDNSGRPKSKLPLVQFKTPPGTEWKKDVTIQFISNDELKIKVGTQLEEFHYSQLGFKKRSKKFPTKQSWGIFKILAERGELPIYPKDVKKSSLNKKAIQEINKILKGIIPITNDGNPIISHPKEGVYRAKFTLISNENVPDEVDSFAYRKYKQTRKSYSKSNLESETETNLDQNED